MMRKIRFPFWILFVVILFGNSAAGQTDDQAILLSVGGEDITAGEFLRVYNKNNIGEFDLDRESVEEYLELYINFRLKVREAEELGMDTVRAFNDELAGYRKQLAEPYFERQEVIDQLLDEVAVRREWDVRTSHILVRVGPYDAPEDTLEAYNMIMAARERIMNGEDFAAVAREVSEDQSARERTDPRTKRIISGNGGDLGYFSVFDMVYPFESAAYNTQVGSVSMPVRTDYGYHILKVTDKIPALGQVQVAHLYLKYPDSAHSGDSLRLSLKMDSIYQRFLNGGKYENLVAEYSDDASTAKRGGILPLLPVQRLVPEFVEAISHMKDSGDVAPPVKTMYGLHLIQLIRKTGIKPFDEVRNDMVRTIKKDVRSQKSRDVVISEVKNEYGFEVYREAVTDFYSWIDSSVYQSKWQIPSEINMDRELLRVGDRRYTQKEFADYLKTHQGIGPEESIVTFVNRSLDQFGRICCTEYLDTRLEEKYPDFRALVKEYRDGILLFELTEEKVWSKAVEDTTGLKNYFGQHREDYQWDERLDASIFTSKDQDHALKARGFA
ncbi:MAG: peptidylprolyl isomerase, partial [Bacteroidales bacterium]|nr:peptidylprolyl isomerase [Bacteroidales bacterium]